MKKVNKFAKKGSLLLLILLLLVLPWFIQERVFAASETGSITIKLKDLETPKSNVGFKIYLVGNWNGTQGSWKLDSSLSSTGVDLGELNGASAWKNAAQTLSTSSELEKLSCKSGTTDDSGEIQFSDLAWGMYLVMQNDKGQYGTIDPFMVPVPYVTDGVQESDRIVSPKAVALVVSIEKQATIELSQSTYTYDGTAKKPTVTVKLGDTKLKKNTDYTVEYSNNKNVGTATVKIKGTGNYKGTISKKFTIKAASIKSAKVTLSKTSYTYDGTAKKPTITVTLNDKKLTKKTHYTVEYSNNKNIGTATVTIKGTGNYTGTVKKTFTIKAKTGTTFTYKEKKYKVTGTSTVAFNGIASTKTTSVTIPATVKYGGKTFKVTSISGSALKNKTKVTSVTIGTNVKTIGASAFYGCENLKVITIKSTKLSTVGKNAFKGIYAKAMIKVPESKLSSYKKLLKDKGQGSNVTIKK